MFLPFALWVNKILGFGLAFSYYVCCLSKMLSLVNVDYV
jgi:hypothetical protein